MNGIVFSRKQIWIATLIGLLALITRLIFLQFYSSQPVAGGDPKAFWSFAQGIASGNGFRSTFEPWLADRPPLYSYFLAGIFLLFGENQTIVFVIQAVLGATCVSIFYLCACQLLDKYGSLISVLFFAIFPHFLLFTQQILTEAIYVPIWVFLLASLILAKPGSKYSFWMAGFWLGLLALTRREALFPGAIVVFFVVWLRTDNQSRLKKVSQMLIITFVMAGLVVAPWLIRNNHLLGKPVMSSSGGINFMVGNNPLGNGAYTLPPQEWQMQFQGLGELDRDQKAWDLSLQWIGENPADFLSLLPKKLLILWGPAHNLALDGADIFLILCCLPGLIRVIRRKDGWNVIGIISLFPVLTTTLIGLVFVGGWRYRLIVYPGLFLLAGYGAMQIVSWYFSGVDFIHKRRNNALTS